MMLKWLHWFRQNSFSLREIQTNRLGLLKKVFEVLILTLSCNKRKGIGHGTEMAFRLPTRGRKRMKRVGAQQQLPVQNKLRENEKNRSF
jgi:hypothetical protein